MKPTKKIRHYEAKPTHVFTPPPAISKRVLLLDRKAGLERQIAAAHKAARGAGREADVKALSATLRAVKKQIAALPALALLAALLVACAPEGVEEPQLPDASAAPSRRGTSAPPEPAHQDAGADQSSPRDAGSGESIEAGGYDAGAGPACEAVRTCCDQLGLSDAGAEVSQIYLQKLKMVGLPPDYYNCQDILDQMRVRTYCP